MEQKRVAILQHMQHGTPAHQFNTMLAEEIHLQETFWHCVNEKGTMKFASIQFYPIRGWISQHFMNHLTGSRTRIPSGACPRSPALVLSIQSNSLAWQAGRFLWLQKTGKQTKRFYQHVIILEKQFLSFYAYVAYG